MKTGKKILLTALSATLATTLTSGLMLTAFADEATKDHEFNGRYDAVFEDFDRADISDTVTAGTGVNTGEKPYLHVAYTAGTSISPAAAIYKQGSGSLEKVAITGGTVTLKMRAPKNDVALSEIKFGVRGVDNDAAVLAKTLDELSDSEGGDLPELTADWQDYEISFANSYEDSDIYPTTETNTVSNTPLLGIHIFAATATDEGTLEIASIKYSISGDALLNDFIGGVNVQDTAKNADAGTWWAGSSEGYIVKRAVNMAGGEFTVVKDSMVGKYSYAVIEADGDIANLKVATTKDGTTWGNAAAYDGYSVALTGEEKGFKFIYDGTAEGGVTIKRIYLTNVVVPAPAIAVPVIDASTADILEDFSVAQKGFTDNWDNMSTAPQLEKAGLEYRISYGNGDKVEVKDGCLVFDATSLGDGYINYKFKSKTASHGDYVVLKVKAADGANLSGFRFALGSPEDVLGDVVWTNQMKAGVDLPVALLDSRNPYKTQDGWYYVVVDIEESGFKLFGEGYSIMDIYYSGAGKLYIDNVFFCNKIDVNVPNIEKELSFDDAKIDVDASTEYAYRYMYILNEGYGTTLEFDVTPKEDNFNISNYRIEFEGVGVYWASENAEGTLLTTDGKKLNELTYEKDKATHVVVDLKASGIEGAFMHVHNHMNAIGGFTVTNVKLTTSTPVYAVKEIDKTVKDLENAFVVQNEAGDAPFELNFVAENAGYQYGCEVRGLNGLNKSYDLLALEIEIAEGTDLSGVRFAFDCGERWAGENAAGGLYLEDGTLLANAGFVAGQAKTVYIDLAKSNITLSNFHIHTNGTGTGSFKINGMKLVNYAAKDFITPAVEKYYAPKYAEQLAALPAALDTTAPEVSITTATTAKAGDEIKIAYKATDDITAAADLKVTVSVTKDGNEVKLSGNKFTAEAGVYTVTVTVRDANGNEAKDTIQITVTAVSSGDNSGDNNGNNNGDNSGDNNGNNNGDNNGNKPGDNNGGNDDKKGGCKSSIGYDVIGVLALAAAAFVTVVIIRTRKNRN